MLTRLEIRNFKGLQDCAIQDLRRINLFIGKNDSGKSTILEAICHMFQELHSPPELGRIMSRRTNVSTGGTELWFGYRTNNPIKVFAWFDSLQFEWEISWAEEEVVSQFFYSISRPKKAISRAHLGVTEYFGDFSRTITTARRMIDIMGVSEGVKDKVRKYASDMSFIDCTLKSNTIEVERALGWLKINGKDTEFGKILSDTYGKGVEWEFMPHPEYPDQKRLAIKEAGRLTYFSDFGDGLRYTVGILGTAMNSENTALLIEEIESHQHSGSLRKLIRHLVEIARENDLQIFLSTHSYNVWESLARGVYVDDTETEKQEFRCFLVERDETTGRTIVESTDDVQKITTALAET